jgi:ferric-dicitrate binding protein FerR (iron transport regulator)
VKPIFQPVIVTGNNPIEPGKLSVGQAKSTSPIITEHMKNGFRFSTLKNPKKNVFVQNPDGSWHAARHEEVILPGNVVKTVAAGSVEVMLDGGEVGRIEIKEGSLFRISKAEKDPATGDKTTLLELAVGKLIAHVEKLKGHSRFEVKSPTALTGVRGTVFEVTVCEKA